MEYRQVEHADSVLGKTALKRGQFFVREFTRIFANRRPIRADLRRLADGF